MRRSIFLGWWGRTHAISLSLSVPPLAVLQQVERSKQRGPLRCCWRGDWWSPLCCVSSKHTHSITLSYVLAMSWLKSLTWCILSRLELVLSQSYCCCVCRSKHKWLQLKLKIFYVSTGSYKLSFWKPPLERHLSPFRTSICGTLYPQFKFKL